jgi:hypothetical protein
MRAPAACSTLAHDDSKSLDESERVASFQRPAITTLVSWKLCAIYRIAFPLSEQLVAATRYIP